MHPLEPLSVDEISTVVGLLVDGGRVGERPVVAWVALGSLQEPSADAYQIQGNVRL